MGSGIDEFAAYSKKHETQPIETSNLFNSFESITASKSSRRISPADTSSQLLYGRIDLGLFGGNAWSENYVVQRIAADITKSYLLGGSNVVLVANPGNGKTRCAEITGYLLASEGHRVYKYTNTSPSIRDEIKLLRLEKCFIIIEDALFRKEILSEFSYDNEILARFLFTSRKAAYEGQRSVLSSMCGGNINEIVLDKLPIEDCRGLLTITSNQGLDSWIPGRRSSQKLDHITDKCARELRAFVLSCFDNEEVRSKLDSIFADMAVSDSMERRFLFLILFCKWIGISLQQPDIETINRESYDKILNKKDHYLFHIVEEKSRYFDINSYALAEYVLRRYFSDRSITDNLLRIVQNNIMRGRYSRDPYYRIISQAMRFGAIEPFLSAHNKRGVILDYYSMLLDIEPVRDLPLFWLQYSIAYTAIEQYSTALITLETARQKAPTSFLTFQIDNQEARLRLVAAGELKPKFPSGLYGDLEWACDILERQFSTESNKTYAITVMERVETFMLRVGARLADDELKGSLDLIRLLISKIDSLPDALRLEDRSTASRNALNSALRWTDNELLRRDAAPSGAQA